MVHVEAAPLNRHTPPYIATHTDICKSIAPKLSAYLTMRKVTTPAVILIFSRVASRRVTPQVTLA